MARKSDPNKKQQIIEIAAAIFAQKGYAGTRMIEIARAADIGKGTIYGYFHNKEALFYSVFQYIVQAPASQIHATPELNSGSAAERLISITDIIITTWLSNLEMYSLVMEFWSAATTLPSRERFKAALRRVYGDMRCLVAGFVHDGIKDGEFDAQTQPDKIAGVVVGALDSFLLQAWLDKDYDAGEVSKIFISLMLKGLQLPEKSP